MVVSVKPVQLLKYYLNSVKHHKYIAMTLPEYFWHRWPSLAGKLSWHVTTTLVNSAWHPSRVAKSSTSFGWGKGGKSPMLCGRKHCVIPYGMWFPVAVWWFPPTTISVAGSSPVMTLLGYFWDRWPCLAGKLSSDITTTYKSIQPCIPLRSLNRVPASAGVKAGSHGCQVAGNTVWSLMACDFP